MACLLLVFFLVLHKTSIIAIESPEIQKAEQWKLGELFMQRKKKTFRYYFGDLIQELKKIVRFYAFFLKIYEI